jgi:hypothetical protein
VTYIFLAGGKMANSQLAKSIFSRKPDDDTIVEDVYKSTSGAVVNSFQDQTGTGGDLYDKFSFLSKFNSGQNLMDPGRLFEEKPSTLDSIKDALGDGASKAKSLIGSLTGGVKSAMAVAKTVTGAVNEAKSAYAQVNGVVSLVKNANLKDLRSATNTLNAITGKTSVLLSPNSVVGAMYGSVVDQASAAGIRDAFGVVAGAVKESTTLINKGQVLHQMATKSLPGTLSRGDYMSAASMVNSLGDGVVGMIDPTAVTKLASNIKTIPPSTSGKGPSYAFMDIKNTFSKMDVNWDISSWKPTSGSTTVVKDLTPLISATPEVKKVFVAGSKESTDDIVKFYAALDTELKARSVDDYNRLKYPGAPTAQESSQKRDVDPRIAAAANEFKVEFFQPSDLNKPKT